MKPTEEQLNAYKQMASQSETMKDVIKAHLVEHCQKYDEALFDRCINHLYETVLEMLGGRDAAVDNQLSGHVPAQTVFRICMDYYDDEIWKKEDEEEAREKAEQEKLEAERKAKAQKKPSKSNTPKVVSSKAGLDKMLEIKGDDVPVQTIPPKSKPVEGQLDMFAMLGL